MSINRHDSLLLTQFRFHARATKEFSQVDTNICIVAPIFCHSYLSIVIGDQ